MKAPIGSRKMQTEVLKEPRGFMRCLELVFAICAFASCANWSTSFKFTVTCAKDNSTKSVGHSIAYPFRLDHEDSQPNPPDTCPPFKDGGNPLTLKCDMMEDASSDAQFFVFTGVLSFLVAAATIAVYVFFSELYTAEQKQWPMVDFCFTVVLAVFWLSSSAAWANGLTQIKWVSASDASNPWLWVRENVCGKSTAGTYVHTQIRECVVDATVTSYTGGHVSVIFGFLNFFLWSANLWFLYKETAWFAGRAQNPAAAAEAAAAPPQQTP